MGKRKIKLLCERCSNAFELTISNKKIKNNIFLCCPYCNKQKTLKVDAITKPALKSLIDACDEALEEIEDLKWL